jgi:hypothetical protein
MRKTKSQAPRFIIGDGTLSKKEEEAMALMLILQFGEREIAEGKYVPVAVAMKRVRARIRRNRRPKR